MFLYYINASILKIKIYISKKLRRKKLFLYLISKTESLIIPVTNSVRYRLTSLINNSSLLSPPPTDCIYFYMNIPQVNIHKRKHPRPWSRLLLYLLHFFFLFLWWTIQTSIISRLHVYSWLNLYKLLLTINGCLALKYSTEKNK
jgi:hypothetical protein